MSSPPNDLPNPAAPSSRMPAKWHGMALAVLEPLSVAVFFIYLLRGSWLRWSDPLIDFPRDLYLAWRLSEGDLLYQKVANWYGPLANLVQGAGFRIFGVGLDTMVWMNIVLTIVSLLLLRAIFGALGNRLSVWLGSLVFLGVFAFNNFSDIANYNFMTPYVAQSTYSLLGLLLVLWGLLRHLKSGTPVWLGVAGFGFAVAYLDKPEATLAAAGVILFYFLAQTVNAVRQQQSAASWLRRGLVWLAGGFLALWAPVLGYFWVRGGFVFSLGAANRVLVTMLDPVFREVALNDPIMRYYMGMDHPWGNFLVELKSGALLTAACGTMALGAWLGNRRAVFSPLWGLGMIAVIASAVLGGWLGMQNAEWRDIGPALVLPVILTTCAAAGWSLRAARCGNQSVFPRALGLAVVGGAASLMLVRMILRPMFSHYGFFMMPLAAWFCIHMMTVEAPRFAAHLREVRVNWLLPVSFSLWVLFAVNETVRHDLEIFAMKTYKIGEGRDHFYTFLPEQSEDGSVFRMTGLMMDKIEYAYRHKTPGAKSLVVFPEGIAVNYHLRVPSPLAEMEFNPAALAYAGQEHILRELQDNPPEVVGFFPREFSEFGLKYFGSDDASGRSIMLWLNAHYNLTAVGGKTPSSITGHVLDLAVPKKEGDKPYPILPAGQ